MFHSGLQTVLGELLLLSGLRASVTDADTAANQSKFTLQHVPERTLKVFHFKLH